MHLILRNRRFTEGDLAVIRTVTQQRWSKGRRFIGEENQMGRKKIRGGPGRREIAAEDFHLADEIRYIQCRAAEYDARLVTIGPLALFSTDTGDAWLLDPGDHLAARIAKDGVPEPIHFEETETNFTIDPTARIAELA